MLQCDDGVLGAHTNGHQQDDDIGGGSGGDWFEGGTSPYILRGGQSQPFVADNLFRGGGNDQFFDAETGDVDFASGQDGNDTINLEDGDGDDDASGGPGNDSCPVDPKDSTSPCTPS
jgi:hypothetical protein